MACDQQAWPAKQAGGRNGLQQAWPAKQEALQQAVLPARQCFLKQEALQQAV